MTTQEIPQRMTVLAIVKTRAEAEDGYVLELDVPEFHSNFPTKVTRVKEAVAKLFPPRPMPYTFILVRQRLKNGKQGKWHTDYFWGLEGLATPAETAKRAANTGGAGPSPSGTPVRQSWGDRTLDIEAAWAIGQAAEVSRFLARNVPPGEYDGADILGWADWFLSVKRSLVAAEVPGQPPQASAEGHSMVNGGAPTSDSDAISGPEFPDLGAVYTYAQQIGFATMKSRLDVPGFKEAIEAKDWPKAAGLLKAAKVGK